MGSINDKSLDDKENQGRRNRDIPTTAWKYRYSRNWDERLRKIRVRASALADKNVPLHPAKDVEVVHDIKMEIVESIQKRLEAGNYKPTLRDLGRLVRLERFLRGSSDRRTKHPDISFEWLEVEDDDTMK